MSSAIYIRAGQPIPLLKWDLFCTVNGLKYNPHVVGRNAFYYFDTQVLFGEGTYKPELPELPDGQLDFSKARPPETAVRIVVSTYFMGNLKSVAEIAQRIIEEFKVFDVECDGYDSEFKNLMGKK